jgi:hypothetical protein
MPHHAKVAHHVRGRIRVKLPTARGNLAVLRQVADSLASRDGVQSVECNVQTGSIVVHYDQTHHENIHQSLVEHGRGSGLFLLAPPEVSEVDQIAESIQREAEFLAEHSEAARKLVEGVKSVNYTLRRATNNNVDLKVLLPLGLAVWAFVQHDPEIATPLWLTLSIFSFNSFVSLHPPVPSVAVDTQQVIKHDGTGSVEDRTTTVTPQKPS